MTQEQDEKYKRLQDRLAELDDLNCKIGRLSLYLSNNGDEPDDEARNTIDGQLDAMKRYRIQLEYRIEKGWY